jgi:RNA polymerase sigma factor (sigma-70 family)
MQEGWSRLAEVLEREKARFLAFARRQLDGFAGIEPEDVLSEVAFRLLRRADVVAEVENLSAYIYRSLANRVTDHRRSRRPTVSLDQAGAEESQDALQPAHDGPGPEQLYQQAQLREQLRAAIGRLGPRERAVWVATEIHGRSFRELAEAWDEPIGTLLSRKSRATARLRALLSEFATHP